MKNYTPIFILILGLALATLLILRPSKEQNQVITDVKDSVEQTPLNTTPTQNPFDTFNNKKVYKSNLDDVSEGETYRFVEFDETAYGDVEASFENGLYSLTANLYNLPDPGAENFYEGWLVKPGEDITYTSTGNAQINEDGVYVNNFDSSEDLTKYTFYVLTFESSLDNNPEPDRHILEGTLVLQKN